MKAIEMTAPGGPDVLRLTERPDPEPGPGEILIEVTAAGVNRPDVMQRRGAYPPPDGASDLPGLEVAGRIAALGEGAEGTLGARVMALLPGGGYAGLAVCDYRHVLPVPDALSDIEAAALPETLFTVFTNVLEDGRLGEGEALLVHGATSGIGTIAGQIARAIGARPYGTAGSAEKCAAAEAHGYERCFDYKTTDWAAAMGDLGGADVVLDMVGGDYVAQNIGLMRDGGRHVSIAILGGNVAKVPIFTVMKKRLVLTGSTLRARDAAEKARLTAAIEDRLFGAIAGRKIVPVIDSTYPLADAAAAHRRMDEDHIGKVVLTVKD